MVLNRYPQWKNILVFAVVLIAFIYALPNFFGEDPAVQVSGSNATVFVDTQKISQIKSALQNAHITFKNFVTEDKNLLIRFASIDEQLKAKELIQETLGQDYLVALNLAPATPNWLNALNAEPMKLGLDLRGGVHFLLQVDVDSVVRQKIEGDQRSIIQLLHDNRIRYTDLAHDKEDNVSFNFKSQDNLDDAYHVIQPKFSDFSWRKDNSNGRYALNGMLDPVALQRSRQDTMEQAMNTLRNRVNELGVSEAVVQQQGANRVSVDLPGIQNTTEAKSILGKTATLEYHMVDVDHDAAQAIGGIAPPNTKLYMDNGRPYLLFNEIILRGSAITGASSGFGEDGRASVNVRLGGGGEGLFTKTTAENVGKPMAVLYVEDKSDLKTVDGKPVITYKTDKRVISVATINSALGNSFQITGLASQEEARNLALLLRAGALPAPVTYLAERSVGPSLGKQNIHMGILSVVVGFTLVVIFMALYYGLLGLIADLALGMNLVLIVAMLSMLGATLTLPGIAGIVLTVGMAVDANVLIFERIREELRNGLGVQASIHAGYERAFMTIVDANLTTLIVAVVLFTLGSGAVKGFAVTLTIGLITSMFTAITGTRAIVNAIYGGRPVKKISIGI